MTGRDGRDWEPTHYRTHTLGEVRDLGAQMIGHEVTVAGYAEAVRGRGAICFLMLRDGTGHLQAFLKKDNMMRILLQPSKVRAGNLPSKSRDKSRRSAPPRLQKESQSPLQNTKSMSLRDKS